MEIQYLQYLRMKIRGWSSSTYSIEPIPLTEIEQLETKYNNGNSFKKKKKKKLRELLFLAGEYCYVIRL